MNNIQQNTTEFQNNDQSNKSDSANASPRMSEDEMKKFVSTLSNAESLEGDYAHNGFLFLFESLAQIIKTNPVEAQNILLHLQLHVFNNLMWESYQAFAAHREKAHLIFNRTEPYVYFETDDEDKENEPETDDESVLDLSAMSAESLNTDDEFTGGTMEELNSEGLALAISGILHNPNLPESIYNGIKRGLGDVFNDLPTELNQELASFEDSPEYLQKLIEYSGENR